MIAVADVVVGEDPEILKSKLSRIVIVEMVELDIDYDSLLIRVRLC